MIRVWKFLLDQNFPGPVVEVAAVDRTITYEPLTRFDASLTKRQTPDWVIYLTAARSGRFDGMVTRDRSQLDQIEELVALADTGLSVVTWQKPVEDSIQEWGQLLAYMPLVTRRLGALEHEQGHFAGHAFFLPRPALGASNVFTIEDALGQEASRQGRAIQDLKAQARREMREELRRRHLSRLDDQLGE